MNPGPLMLIGGAEDKLGARVVLSRFVKLAGGPQARIAVVATASSLGEEAVEIYREVFGRLGVADVRGPRPTTREEAADPEVVAQLDGVTGIFMTGGNQSTLTGAIAGTPFGSALLAAHSGGAVIAGTSAGASAQSDHMVAFGAEGATPKLRMVAMSAGLGLIRGVVVDQHFEQRNRFGRLMTLVAHSPHLLGLGIDEDTAAVVTDGRYVEVIGKGALSIFDASSATSNVDTARGSQPLLLSGVVVHSLPAGARFDLAARTLLPSLRGRKDDLREVSPAPATAAAAKPSKRTMTRLLALEGAVGRRVDPGETAGRRTTAEG
ncbi:MAG TPA: cyanophycinase [Mycobacteriales bacterium]|nr:cyanophycinase [Mycobacteriales bacterium]